MKKPIGIALTFKLATTHYGSWFKFEKPTTDLSVIKDALNILLFNSYAGQKVLNGFGYLEVKFLYKVPAKGIDLYEN